ncbi:hypothetical protein O974_00050 [Mycobacterium avium 11-0986]|nr:hypothetical protein O974_00050 [Mycobacterium avium 11-0986]
MLREDLTMAIHEPVHQPTAHVEPTGHVEPTSHVERRVTDRPGPGGASRCGRWASTRG